MNGTMARRLRNKIYGGKEPERRWVRSEKTGQVVCLPPRRDYLEAKRLWKERGCMEYHLMIFMYGVLVGLTAGLVLITILLR